MTTNIRKSMTVRSNHMAETGMQAFSVQKIKNGVLALPHLLATVSSCRKLGSHSGENTRINVKLAIKMHIDMVHIMQCTSTLYT